MSTRFSASPKSCVAEVLRRRGHRVTVVSDDAFAKYAWDAMANLTPLTEPIAAELAAQKRIGMWNGVGALCGSPSQVRAAKQTIRSVLRKKTDRITFLSVASFNSFAHSRELAAYY
jgi:uncharacterized protein YbjT (DUF2867 family)